MRRAMRSACSALVGALLCVVPARAQADAQQPAAQANVLASIAAIAPAALIPQRSAVLAIAAARLLNPNEVTGVFGELLSTSSSQLGLPSDRSYTAIGARSSRQGIDTLLREADLAGRPTGKFVAVEAKFSKSRPKLNMTKTGFQGSSTWVLNRMKALQESYAQFATALADNTSSSTVRPKNAIDVKLPSGKKGWIGSTKDGAVTSFTDPTDILAAKNFTKTLAADLAKGIKSGAIPSRVMWVKPVPGGYEVLTAEIPKSLDPSKPPNISKLPGACTVKIAQKDLLVAKAGIAAIKKQIQAQIPGLGSKEAAKLAKEVFDSSVAFHEYVRMTRNMQITASVKMVGGSALGPIVIVGGGALFQLLMGDTPDWGRVVKDFSIATASAGIGTGVGIAVSSLAIENQRIGSVIRVAGRFVGLNALSSYRLAGGFAGGTAAAIAFAYGEFFVGNIDLETANTAAAISVGGALVAVGAEAIALATIAAYATASTGSAISALSGAAAINASLAWVGGGSIAAGGFGMAGGAMILTGGGAVIAVAAVYAITAAYETYSTKVQLEQHLINLQYARDNFAAVIRESPTTYKQRFGAPRRY